MSITDVAAQAKELLADLSTAEGMADKAAKKNKGGRPKGSKTRPPHVILRERLYKHMLRLPVEWYDHLAKNEIALYVQILKRLIAPISAEPVEQPKAEGNRVYRVRFEKTLADEDMTPARKALPPKVCDDETYTPNMIVPASPEQQRKQDEVIQEMEAYERDANVEAARLVQQEKRRIHDTANGHSFNTRPKVQRGGWVNVDPDGRGRGHQANR